MGTKEWILIVAAGIVYFILFVCGMHIDRAYVNEVDVVQSTYWIDEGNPTIKELKYHGVLWAKWDESSRRWYTDRKDGRIFLRYLDKGSNS